MFAKQSSAVNEHSEKSASGSKRPKSLITINERCYPLNPSKSKFISVGLAYEWSFQPIIIIRGCRNDCATFTESEWYELLEYEGVLVNYFHCVEEFQPIVHGTFTVMFEKFKDMRTIKLQDRFKNIVYLGLESVLNMIEMTRLIAYTINTLKGQEFATYFNSLLSEVRATPLDVRDFVADHVADIPRSENVRSMMELAYRHPDLPEFQKAATLSYHHPTIPHIPHRKC